jgi:phenol 2-monooxygenase
VQRHSSQDVALKSKIVDLRSGPLFMCQADCVQCGTVEDFESFGILEELLREAYHVLETVFRPVTGKWRMQGKSVAVKPGTTMH